MDFITLLATVTLHWTNPVFLPDSFCNASQDSCHLTGANIYRQEGSDIERLLRTHVYASQMPSDTIQVPDSPVATYSVKPVNAVGESECPTRGVTVGVPNVGVGPLPQMERRPLYDIAGRRIHPPYASGVFFTKDRHIVIIK